jgi:hypothetical protein
VTVGPSSDEGDLDRRATKLAMERAALFDKAGASFGLSEIDQRRLKVVEGELDECFLARRRQRAVTDARRFERDGTGIRRVARPPVN